MDAKYRSVRQNCSNYQNTGQNSGHMSLRSLLKYDESWSLPTELNSYTLYRTISDKRFHCVFSGIQPAWSLKFTSPAGFLLVRNPGKLSLIDLTIKQELGIPVGFILNHLSVVIRDLSKSTAGMGRSIWKCGGPIFNPPTLHAGQNFIPWLYSKTEWSTHIWRMQNYMAHPL